MKNDLVLVIDAGGSYFKSSLINEKFEFLSEVNFVAVNSNGTKEQILDSFKKTIDLYREKNIEKIYVSIPGPFNYAKKTSLMKHKFESIYGLDLEKEINNYCNSNFAISFSGDANSFLLGQIRLNPELKNFNVAGITLGTGLGFALSKNGKILTNDNGTAKEIIYNYDCDGKILEDYVSKRGIVNRYNELSGEKLTSPKNVALKNNIYSIQAYSEMGEKLGKSISSLLAKYSIDFVVFGGQISKSLYLFKKSFLNELNNIKVIEAINIDNSSLIGAKL